MNQPHNEIIAASEIDTLRLLDSRLAGLLKGILALAIVVALLILAANLVQEGISPRLWIVGSALPLMAVLLLLAARGHTRSVTWAVVVLFYVLIVAVTVSRGTIHNPSYALVIVVTAVAGLMLGRRSMIAVLASGVLVLAGLAYAEASGLMQAADRGTLFGHWLAISAFAGITGAAFAFARGMADDALIRASQEVVERREAERSLGKSEALHRGLFESAADALLVLDHGAVIDCNPAAERMFGVGKRGDLLGKHPGDLSPATQTNGADSRSEANRLIDAAQPRENRVFEWLHRRLDTGESFPAEVLLNRVQIDGQTFLQATVRDITERKRFAEALGAAEEQFRGLVEQSIAGIYIIQDDKFTYVNPRFAEILGYASAEELVGRDWLSLIVENERAALTERLSQWRKGGTRSVSHSNTALRKDGSSVDVGVHSTLANYKGRPATIGLMQDISEKKLAEEKIQHYVKRLETAFTSTVEVVTTLSEMRDPYTAGHQRRVADIAVAIGAELGFDANRREGLHAAGHLHDIGKITIPSEILSKPGKLSAIEFQLIQTHAQSGYDVLKSIEFPWPVADVALQHHERLDGSGYPRGLRGEAIILEARIMAVADVVEAMSSHRPYRPGLGLEKALAEIERGRGTAYDAAVADACLKLFRAGQFQLPV